MDDKPPMPPQPATVALEKPPAWAISILEKVDRLGAEQRAEFTALRLDLDVVNNQVKVLNGRASLADRRLDEFDKRASATSDRVRGVSENDLTQEAKLADHLIWRSKIDTQMDSQSKQLADIDKKTNAQTEMLKENERANIEIKQAVTGFVREHPQIVTAFFGLLMSVMGYLASYLNAKGH